MKKILLRTIFLLTAFNSLNAQNEFRSDWANYINYGIDMPNSNMSSELNVEEYTGALTYNFGIHQIIAGGRPFPVSINYYSSGVKVDDYASCVGMGWSLNAGGTITKITRGLDDDFINANGIGIGYNFPVPSGMSRSAYWSYTGQLDTEKDYYVFSAFGLSGTFYYSKPQEKFLPLNGEKISISRANVDGVMQFVITDYSGTSYYFGLTESLSQFFDNEQSPRVVVDGSFYLTKVILPNKEELTLSYESKVINRLQTSVNEYNTSRLMCPNQTGCNTGGCHSGNYYKKKGFTTSSGYRLKQINWTNGQILFNYSNNNRTDIPEDYALVGIELLVNNSIVKRLLLEQSYISNRLMLNRILDITGGLQYTIPLITLEYYNDFTLPLPFSLMSQDLFGYFNNDPAVANCLSNENSLLNWYEMSGSYCYPDVLNGPGRTIKDSSVARTLLLSKLYEAKGKVQEIEYDNNYHLSDLIQNQNGSYYIPIKTAGLRVYRLTTYTTTKPEEKRYKEYLYSDLNGVCSGLKLFVETDRVIPYKFANRCNGVLRLAGTSNRKSYLFNTSVYYTVVRVREYTDANNPVLTRIGTIVNRYSYAGGSYCERFRWGKLKTSEEYNKNGFLIGKLENQFVEDIDLTNQHGCAYGMLINQHLPSNGYYQYLYTMNSGQLLLTNSIKTEYNTEGALVKQTKTSYTYNSRKDVSRVDYYVNNILKNKVYIKRPYDYQHPATGYDDYTSAIQKFNERNITAPVIETIKTKMVGTDEYVENSTVSLSKYDNINDIILPAKELSFKKHVPILYSSFQGLSFNNGTPEYHSQFESLFDITKANSKGYVNELVQNNNLYTSNLVNSEGATIAKFTNARFNEIAFMGYEPYELENTSATSIINDNWTMASTTTCLGTVVVTGGFSGNYSIDFSKCLGFSFLFNKTLDANKNYKLRYWKKSGALNVSPNSGTVTAELILLTANGWSLVERTITGATYIAIGSTTAQVDDVVLYPEEADVEYINYDNVKRKTSECNSNGDCQFYEYDPIHRITTIRDSKQNIIKKIEYGIQEQQ